MNLLGLYGYHIVAQHNAEQVWVGIAEHEQSFFMGKRSWTPERWIKELQANDDNIVKNKNSLRRLTQQDWAPSEIAKLFLP